MIEGRPYANGGLNWRESSAGSLCEPPPGIGWIDTSSGEEHHGPVSDSISAENVDARVIAQRGTEKQCETGLAQARWSHGFRSVRCDREVHGVIQNDGAQRAGARPAAAKPQSPREL